MISETKDPFSFASRFRRTRTDLLFKLKQRVSQIIRQEKPRRGIAPYLGYDQNYHNNKQAGYALISYLSEPFRLGREASLKHSYSNYVMSIEMAQALTQLGYIVDIIDWTDREFTPTEKYNVFIGMGSNWDRLLPYLAKQCVKVYWATRSERNFELSAAQQRYEGIALRQGYRLEIPSIQTELLESSSIDRANAIIAMGSETTIATFAKCGPPVFRIHNPAQSVATRNWPYNKNWERARQHFLFLSSWLFVVKGLDLLLEAFIDRPNLHLWICGPLDTELDLQRIYRRALYKSPNIHPVGWVQLDSEVFQELADLCGFIIFPSCSEGMSGSLINCMSAGLVPLATPEGGVDCDFLAITLNSPTSESIALAAETASSWEAIDLRKRAMETKRIVDECYSLERFRETLQDIFQKILARPERDW